ncbi:unnamed protein product, partial [Nippostrongylus brasiliensis]|uniref:CCHC-type domain-containing protein n=1 Tax=Nippostrongylus brasiliensis TaxID=27835 RepID=A0A0N4XRN9_NIPBR
MHEKLDDAYEDQNAAHTPSISAINLSPVPIPKFSGRIWEWENFWHVFNHSIHSQNINNLHKMSYLLDALQGEAKESVEMFEVSELTYPLVINHLKEKYGDNRVLVDELLTKLQNCTARSERLIDQHRLCEEITSIVPQLELKNEHVDNTFLQKQIMAKFSVAVQSAVLRQKQHFAVDTWTTRSLLETVKGHIKAELNIVRQVEMPKEDAHSMTKHKAMERQEQQNAKARRNRFTCFFCRKSEHRPKDCEEFPTREKRIEAMKKQNLCLNCGRQGHAAAACSSGACRQCGVQGHHTSICKNLFSSHPPVTSQAPPKRSKPFPKASNELRRMSSARTHIISSEDAEPEQNLPSDTVLYMEGSVGHSDTFLLIGQAQVLNPRTQNLEVVHILLDTGADRSFVSKTLAERLQLNELNSKHLTITTFGSTTPLKQ